MLSAWGAVIPLEMKGDCLGRDNIHTEMIYTYRADSFVSNMPHNNNPV